MFDLRILCNLLILAGFAQSAAAVEVVQCEDDRGQITYQSACPPGTKEVGKRDYSGATRAAAQDEPSAERPEITLYVVPECDACAQFREFFDSRDIAYTSRDVKDDAVLQAELKKRSGELRAPTVMVGEKAVVGYNRGALIAALKEAGYLPEDDSGEGEAAAEEAANP